MEKETIEIGHGDHRDSVKNVFFMCFTYLNRLRTRVGIIYLDTYFKRFNSIIFFFEKFKFIT